MVGVHVGGGGDENAIERMFILLYSEMLRSSHHPMPARYLVSPTWPHRLPGCIQFCKQYRQYVCAGAKL